MPPTILPEGRQRRSAPKREDVVERARKATQGIKVGRPLTYDPSLCDRAIAFGIAGKHPAAIARDFGIDRATLIKWERQYPEFSSAMSRAREAARAWWEDDIQRARKGKHYQAQAVKALLGANQEDYRDVRPSGGAELMVDFLTAIADLSKTHAAKPLPGDQAKPIEPLSVASAPANSTPSEDGN